MSPPTLYVTFVRHGESTDNLRTVWAGWKDAPLSNHGMNQARAVGEYFSNVTKFDAIYASPLKRAFTTAQAIYDRQPEPKPPLTTSLLVREQHFGIAEGKPWSWTQEEGLTLQEHFAKGIYPVLHGDREKFPEGESLVDLGERANQAVEDIILPHVWQAAREGKKDVHVAIVSHGLCISQMVAQLLKRNAGGIDIKDYRGLLNTAWTRVAVDVKGSEEDKPVDIPDDDDPPLSVYVTDINQHSHIDNILRQKGGIGNAAYDPKQADIRAFFGGKTDVGGGVKSNANDEIGVEFKPGSSL
ncbi:hypothetical protein EWM64_g1544 [Hericium alpestre]|uniref:Phosphoglycerate mutase-like protein n=1 Tax=Hericium alpestre TaxID=135208 RepID=A0A4Z0A971_9AGAM|nr:hypothetical protein EWM64_g1544 [Hericium alpestre]